MTRNNFVRVTSLELFRSPTAWSKA